MPEWAGMVFLKFNGSTFSAAAYPKLALVIPTLTLPEARGEFPRIWDDGRGVDSGRTLLSAQGDAIRNITGKVMSRGLPNNANPGAITSGDGVFRLVRGVTNDESTSSPVTANPPAAGLDTLYFDADRVVPTASENRPRNIAFNLLVRAK